MPVTGRPLTLLATMMSMALYTESCGRTAITSVVMMSATSRSSKQPYGQCTSFTGMPNDSRQSVRRMRTNVPSAAAYYISPASVQPSV